MRYVPEKRNLGGRGLTLYLAGDDGRARAVAVIEYLQNISATLVRQRCERPVVDYQDVGFGELGQRFCIAAVTTSDGQCW